MWRACCLLVAVFAWCVLPTPAAADTLVLEDGRVLEGVAVEASERGFEIPFPHGRVVLAKAAVHLLYADGDPAGAAALRKMQEHAKWRNRARHTGAHFRYETTAPALVFERYRTTMEDHFGLLVGMLDLSDTDAPSPTVNLYASHKMFQRMGGVGRSSTGFFRHREPLELNLFDERVTRVVHLQDARWLTAAYAVHRAWPDLPRGTFLRQALTHYYGSVTADEDAPGGVRARVAGALWQVLFRDRDERDLTPDLAHVNHERAEVREAWGWVLVHFLLSSEAYAEAFRRYVGAARESTAEVALDGLREALGVEAPEARAKLLAAWEVHIRSLEPSTGVAWVRAAEEAASDDDAETAERHYRKATTFAEARRAGLAGVARALKARGRDVAELDALRAVLAEDPLDVEARRRLAVCLRAADAEKEAAREDALATEIGATFRRP